MAGFRINSPDGWDAPAPADKAAAAALSAGLGVSAAMGRLLYRRGHRTADEARAFIKTENGAIHDPFLLPDMRRAVDAIVLAIDEHKKIAIYGDYDADGITSVSVLYLFLSDLGADVSYRIPKRSEGYGMSRGAIEELSKAGVELIITVDTGTTATDEVAYAYSLGMKVVVTDHHECTSVLPDAEAVVNPQRHDSRYPFSGLAGVGVVYKLLCALGSVIRGVSVADATVRVSEQYIDLVAIGTVADVMPILDENRVIVSGGLRRIEAGVRPGIAALTEADAKDGERTKKKQRIGTGYVSFTMAPRINAAGRLGDASTAVELFLTDDSTRAAYLAGKLCELNRERQRLENIIAGEAVAKIESTHDFDNDPVIVVAEDGWHQGVIGIVSSRVTEKYGMPSVLISFEGEGGEHDIGKGSGRSIPGLDLAAALAGCGDCLIKSGGHGAAAGLTVERGKLEEFRKKINSIARKMLSDAKKAPAETADDILSPDELTVGLAEEIRLLEPFGIGNATPLFITEDMTVVSVTGVGADKHTKLLLSAKNGAALTGMCFSVSPGELGLEASDTVDVMYNLDLNEYRGEKTAQLTVRGIRECAAERERDAEDERIYASLRSGEADPSCGYGAYVPDRGELAAVYRAVRAEVSSGRHEHSAKEIAALAFGKNSLKTVKTKLSLDIFAEMDILSLKAKRNGRYDISLPEQKKKVDLERSEILGALRRKYSR